MWQNVTVRARAQSWFGQALASTSTNLYVIENGALTALRYCNGIHNKIVRPYLGAIGPEFILMGDNAGPHCAHLTNVYLKHETIVRMDWPAQPQDLNQIEHARDILQHVISARPVQHRTLQELNNALAAEWRLIQQNGIWTLITSMHSRCSALMDASGRHTNY